jgi:hypothetical protein
LKLIFDPSDNIIIVIGNDFKKALRAGHYTLPASVALTAIIGDVS